MRMIAGVTTFTVKTYLSCLQLLESSCFGLADEMLRSTSIQKTHLSDLAGASLIEAAGLSPYLLRTEFDEVKQSPRKQAGVLKPCEAPKFLCVGEI